MANYNKKKSIGRVIAGVLCGVMCVAAVAGAGTALYMGAKNNGWFEKEDNTEVVEQEATANSVVVNEGASNGIKLTSTAITPSGSSSTFSGDSYTITAELYPEDATNQSVTWSLSDNASGYVTLTSSGLSATVTCTAAFSEQITVTCTSSSNSSIYGTITLDYAKKITSVSGGFYGITNSSATFTAENAYEITDDTTGYVFSASADTSVGTISDTYTYSESLSVPSAFVTALKNDYGISGIESNTLTSMSAASGSSYATFKQIFAYIFGDDIYDGGTNQNAFNSALQNWHSTYHLTYTITATGTYSSMSVSYGLYIDSDLFEVMVTSLSTNVTSLIF